MLTSGGSETLAAADFAGCGDAAVAAVENQVEAAGDGTIFVISRAGAAGAAPAAAAPPEAQILKFNLMMGVQPLVVQLDLQQQTTVLTLLYQMLQHLNLY